MKKNNLILMIVTVSIFVVLLVGATYAYFASNTNVGNGLDFSTTLDDNNIAFAATSGSLSLHVKAENMLESQTGNGAVLAAESVGEDNIIITLSSNTETPIACTYNMYFKWNENYVYSSNYNDFYNEFTLELDLLDNNGTGSEGINAFAGEKPIITGANKTKIVNGAYIVGSSSDPGSQEWIPTAKFYNLTRDQSALAGETFSGKFTIEDVECNAMKNLSETIIGLVSDDEYISSQTERDWYTNAQYNNLPYVVKHEEVEYNGTTYDAGVRYEGRSPDNYVIFNGELWRIIGVFEGSTIGLEPGKQYTKIINILDYIQANWDSNNKNDWENSTLNTFLNNDYLNGNGQLVHIKDYDDYDGVKSLTLNAKNKIAKYNGNYSTWYLRAPSLNNYQNATTEDWFLMERLTGGLSSLNENDTIVSAVALMYPSDYGFAAYGDVCDTNLALASYGDLNYDTLERVGCAQVDWLLYDGCSDWLISPIADTSNKVFGVFGDDALGWVEEHGSIYQGVFRPVLYLEHDIKIAGGAGSLENPYKLN